MPVEVYELIRHPTATGALLLAFNLLVMGLMVRALRHGLARQQGAANKPGLAENARST